jgi:hypothetical protein
MPHPDLLALSSLQEVLVWYERNLCNAVLIDRRGYRVRFQPQTFIHLIQLKTKYGKEPKNRRMALEEIRKGRIHFVPGRFSPQRAQELSWAEEIATIHDYICGNWQPGGTGAEAYIKNFGTEDQPKCRVMVCKIRGTLREVVTIFPREYIGEHELAAKIWP